jgi:hypothetical protein
VTLGGGERVCWRSGSETRGTAVEVDQVHPLRGDPPVPHLVDGIRTVEADGNERAHLVSPRVRTSLGRLPVAQDDAIAPPLHYR